MGGALVALLVAGVQAVDGEHDVARRDAATFADRLHVAFEPNAPRHEGATAPIFGSLDISSS